MTTVARTTSAYYADGGPASKLCLLNGLWCRLHRWVPPISDIMYTIAVKQSQGLSVNFVKTERNNREDLCRTYKKHGNLMEKRWAERGELPVCHNACCLNA